MSRRTEMSLMRIRVITSETNPLSGFQKQTRLVNNRGTSRTLFRHTLKNGTQTHNAVRTDDKLNALKMWAKARYGQVSENMPLAEVEMSREEIMQFLNGNIK